MPSVTMELQRLIDEEKKKIDIQDKRTEQRQKLEIEASLVQEVGGKSGKDEEELRKGRRKGGIEKSFRGCTEEEKKEDLMKIFGEERPERCIHTLPDGRNMTVIKRTVITEGDIVKIEKGEVFEVGEVKYIHRGVLVLESREREKKYLINKLLSSRYVITPANLGRNKSRTGNSDI